MNHDLIIHFALLFIEIQTGFTIQANFYGRFDIERNDNDDCNNDYIMIILYNEETQNWNMDDDKVQKFCGRQMPNPIQLNNANKLRIIFSSNNDVNGDGFSVSLFLYIVD